MSTFAWQGWRIELPEEWNPVKLDGSYERGHALIADMSRPRLGIRWATPRGRSFDVEAWALRALHDEVGTLAAKEACPFRMPHDWQSSMLYVDSDPPGRDVWVAQSSTSGRLIEIVHHCDRDDRAFAETILPALRDTDRDEQQPWSVFDLSCAVPPDYELSSHRLNAGDLSLSFACGWRTLLVRQIALAAIALERMPLANWLAAQERLASPWFVAVGEPRRFSIGAELTGLSRLSQRRRRFAWMRWLPQEQTTLALHDSRRDRLVIVQATEPEIARQVASTVGRVTWAA